MLGGKLYVYGTCGPDGMTKSGMYAYDPATNSWGGRLTPSDQGYPAMAAVGGRLYMAGGQSTSGTPGRL